MAELTNEGETSPQPAGPVQDLKDMADLVSLCKRRGFVFPSSEVYGGINACWDYGPLGIELKRNVKERWWRAMTDREDVEGIDAAILMHPRVWEASGHVAGFVDPLVDCKKCKSRFRADKIDAAAMAAKKCPNCGGELTEPRQFNLMFKTFMGFPERPAVLATEDPFRNRTDRQGVPKRDHSRQFHLPHPRVRADGDAVLRQARHGHGMVREVEGRAHPVASR
jgi:hypothetical protein